MFDIETLRALNIFDLRQLGREVGIPSPTSQTKPELIKGILALEEPINGISAEKSRGRRRGRRPLSHVTDILAKVKQNSLARKGDDKDAMINSPLGDVDLNSSSPDALSTAEGYYYCSFEEGLPCFFKSGRGEDLANPVKVPLQIANSTNVKNGDRVRVRYAPMAQNVAKSIELKEAKKKFTPIDNLARGENKNKISIDKFGSVLEGSRNVIFLDSFRNLPKYLPEKLSSDLKYISIFLDALPEMEIFGEEKFYSTMGDKSSVSIDAFGLGLSRLKRLLEEGERVVVFVNDLFKLVEYQNFKIGNSIDEVKDGTMDMIAQLLALAGSYKNGGSLTIFAFYKSREKLSVDYYIKDEIENFNCNEIKF